MTKRQKPVEDHGVSIADLPKRRAPEFRSLYANFAMMSAAQHDVSIMFDEIVPGEAGPEIVEQVRIVMTPTFARSLAAVLVSNIEKWERIYGSPDPAQGEEG